MTTRTKPFHVRTLTHSHAHTLTRWHVQTLTRSHVHTLTRPHTHTLTRLHVQKFTLHVQGFPPLQTPHLLFCFPWMHNAKPPHALHQCRCLPCWQIDPPPQSAHNVCLRKWTHTLCPFLLIPGLQTFSAPEEGVWAEQRLKPKPLHTPPCWPRKGAWGRATTAC
jgi:hypothetical protein